MAKYRFVAYQTVPASPQLEKDVLCILASLENMSQEPTTDIVQVAAANGVLPISVEHFQEFMGRGLGGLIRLSHEQSPRPVLMGTYDFVTQCNLQIPELLDATIRKWQDEPDAHLIFLGWERSVRAIVQCKPLE